MSPAAQHPCSQAHFKYMIRSLIGLLQDPLLPIWILLVIVRHKLTRTSLVSRAFDVVLDFSEFLIGRGVNDRLGSLRNSELGGSKPVN